MKKLFYGLGAVAAAATPVVAVVSCGSKHGDQFSGKVESLKAIFTDAGLNASEAELAKLATFFTGKAIFELEKPTATGSTTPRNLVIVRGDSRLTEAQAIKMADDFAKSQEGKAVTGLAGTETFTPVTLTSWQGVVLTEDDLAKFAYSFTTNANGHIRVRAVVMHEGKTCEYDKPVFAINLANPTKA